MPIRDKTLWRIPGFCPAAGWVSYYLTVYFGGFFFTVETVVDGVTHLSADPIRSLIFSGVLFAVCLLLGGLWLFRDMTRKELALSAAIASGLGLAVVLAQLYLPGFSAFGVTLAPFQNWDVFLSSLLMQLIGNVTLSVILPAFSPFLFVLFGKRK